MKLVFATPIAAKFILENQSLNIKDNVIFNFGSFWNFGVPVPELYSLPFGSVDFNNEEIFDAQYEQYIINFEPAFQRMMNIMFPIYEGYDVLIVSDIDNGGLDMIKSSFIKLIQKRYGINPYEAIQPEDAYYVNELRFTSDGRQFLLADKERYIYGNIDFFLNSETAIAEEGV